MTWHLGSVGLPTSWPDISDINDLEMQQVLMQNVSTIRWNQYLVLDDPNFRQCLLDCPAIYEQQCKLSKVRQIQYLGVMTHSHLGSVCLIVQPHLSNSGDARNEIWNVNVECKVRWNQYLGRDDPESRLCQPDRATTSDKLSLVIEYQHKCLHLYVHACTDCNQCHYAFSILTILSKHIKMQNWQTITALVIVYQRKCLHLCVHYCSLFRL